jgi:G3E family GTPase
MEAGFGMEFDVRLLGDGSVVVFHDANLKRLTGRDAPLIAQTRGDILPLRLADSREAVEQVAFADQIILNKTDLVTPAELAEVERMIRKLNPLAPIHRAERSNVPLDLVLGRGSFDLARIEEIEPGFLNPAHGEPGHVHDETCDHDHHGHDHHGHHHGHDHHDHDIDATGIRGISLTSRKPLNANRFTAWLNEVLQAQGPDILRAKGILDVAGEDRRLVFQAVHMILEGDFQGPWKSDADRYSRLVFIGRNLDEAKLREGFESTFA